MSDALSFAEIDGQHVELLPARTVLSMFSLDGGGANTSGGCENGFEPNQAVSLLGLGGAAGFASNGCSNVADAINGGSN